MGRDLKIGTLRFPYHEHDHIESRLDQWLRPFPQPCLNIHRRDKIVVLTCNKTTSTILYYVVYCSGQLLGPGPPRAQIRGPGASVNSTDHSLLRCVLQQTTSQAWATQGPELGAWSIHELNRPFFTTLCTTTDNFSGLGHPGPRFGGLEHP